MERGRMLASLAIEALAKQNDEPAGRLTSKRLKKKSECVRTSYPNYVDMFDIGKWNELDEYLKYNKGSTGLDICTKVFNKKKSEPINFEVCKTVVRDVCEAAVGEGEAGETVVFKTVLDETVVRDICEAAVSEGEAGETTVVRNVLEAAVGEAEASESVVIKTVLDETVVRDVCEAAVSEGEAGETTVVHNVFEAAVDEVEASESVVIKTVLDETVVRDVCEAAVSEGEAGETTVVHNVFEAAVDEVEASESVVIKTVLDETVVRDVCEAAVSEGEAGETTVVHNVFEAAVDEVEASESVVIKTVPDETVVRDICDTAVDEGEAGETTVVDQTLVGLHNVCTVVEVELGETLVGEVYEESEVCKGDVGKTSVGETVVGGNCESELCETAVCEIRDTEVVEIFGNAPHELENSIMSTEESMVSSVDPIRPMVFCIDPNRPSGELVCEESHLNSQQEENITKQLFSTEESLSLDEGIGQVNLEGSISGFEHMSDEEFSTNVNRPMSGVLVDHRRKHRSVSEETRNEINSCGVKTKPVAIVVGTPCNTPIKDDSQSNRLQPVLPTGINFEELPNSPESVASVEEDNNDPDYEPISSDNESSETESHMEIDSDCNSVVPKTPEKENRPILSNIDEHCTEASLKQSFLDDSCNESIENGNVIKLNKVKKNERGLITRNKGHCCMFCNNIMINLARHFELKHDKEFEVAKLLAMPKTSRARRQGFIELSRIGDYYHNCEVLTKGCGELILVRRPGPEEDQFNYSNYGPCPYCLGFMIKKHLWHHSKYSCTVREKRENTKNSQNVMNESKILLSSSLNPDLPKEFVENILSQMREDDISSTVKGDPTVVKYGVLQFEKYGLTQTEMIRQHMRQLGRLILALQDQTLFTSGDKKKLSVWLHPTNFDSLVLGVKKVCIQDEKNCQTLRPQLKIPSLALKLGHSLRKCISIERGVALRSCNKERNEELKDLLNLLELEWTVKISSNALAAMNSRRMNKTKILPLTDDLVKLNNFISSELKKNNLEWSRLAELTLCKIVLFNKRRSGEASKLTLSTYTSKTNWINEGTQETNMCLSDLEKKLASRLGLIEIRGKRGRTVPIILTPEVKENLDLLISKRQEAGVAKENPFVFARGGGSLLHLRGHDCLRKVCIEAELQSPELITSTNLRKYIATVIQLFNLSENETDWLARHLGHDVRVHRQYYRTQEEIIETTKVSRLLLAVEQGKAHLFHGKKLKDINVDLLDYTDESDSESDELEEKSSPVRKGTHTAQLTREEDTMRKKAKRNSGAVIYESDSSIVDDPPVHTNKKKKYSGAVIYESDSSIVDDPPVHTKKKKKYSGAVIYESDSSIVDDPPVHTKKKKKCSIAVSDSDSSIHDVPTFKEKKACATKRPWNDEEKESVITFFRSAIKNNIIPRKEDCEKCKQKSTCLERRSWREIKYYIYNYIKKVKKNVNL